MRHLAEFWYSLGIKTCQFVPSKNGAGAKVELFSCPLPSSRCTQILLLEDNAARAGRRHTLGVSTASAEVVLRVHKIRASGISLLRELIYSPGSLPDIVGNKGRAALALNLLDATRVRPTGCIVVAGPSYGGNAWFAEELRQRGFNWVMELPRGAVVLTEKHKRGIPARKMLSSVEWTTCKIVSPTTGNSLEYAVARLGSVSSAGSRKASLFAAQTGAIHGVHGGTIIGISSLGRASLKDLLSAVGWARWIRPTVRLNERNERDQINGRSRVAPANVSIAVRSNIKLARQYDESVPWSDDEESTSTDGLKGVLKAESPTLNVVELFAGAGGMGLGFVLAGGQRGSYRLGFSGEVHPIYSETLRSNHEVIQRVFKQRSVVPESIQPTDLRENRALHLIKDTMKEVGDIHILIGGPPCQGFSNANRNSWHSSNPHNELVDVFLKYVTRLQPRIFLMENVQGILWTPKYNHANDELSVVSAIAAPLRRAGYLVFPKLLDAVWYGVPQYRSRFFLLGIHRDVGYRTDDFGSWGPYPRPTHGPGTERRYATVRDAIRDLPRIGNGHEHEERSYLEPENGQLSNNPYLSFVRQYADKHVISDHVTSRHADYVLDRYRQIPPGGNWEDISHSLTNYADVKRTHSNIYRRLKWDEPSITIGHYRKSMLVHPSQNRGLSLREASRLQSFPDWFRFAGTVDGTAGGLMHKQQQLANAVSPLVTKSVAEFLSRL